MITFVTQLLLCMTLEHLNSMYSLVKTPELFGRYITNTDIEKCFVKFPKSIISTIGFSEENRPIYSFNYGNGSKKILLWSQMHGNESTTTKALFDCFNLFMTNTRIPNSILSECSLLVIPILNPDGAEHYTRLNANDVDLNRDAQDLTQLESKVLRKVYDDFKPDYCFNLHGQRTIYNVGNTKKSSVLSFLSPSQNEERSLTLNRKMAMSIISKINLLMQEEIPNGIARYDDGFNLNCVGDTFQNFGVPTILYEAGHYPGDYNREVVRRLMFSSILKGLEAISNGVDAKGYKQYFDIPENGKQFYDVIIRNAKLNDLDDETVDIAFQFEERLVNGKIDFVPKIEKIGNLDTFFGHKEIDANNNLVKSSENLKLKIANEIDFVSINNEEISLKS